jgi:hypothetical protein
VGFALVALLQGGEHGVYGGVGFPVVDAVEGVSIGLYGMGLVSSAAGRTYVARAVEASMVLDLVAIVLVCLGLRCYSLRCFKMQMLYRDGSGSLRRWHRLYVFWTASDSCWVLGIRDGGHEDSWGTLRSRDVIGMRRRI